MICVQDAIGKLLKDARRLVGVETVALSGALGRTLAEDVVSPLDVPPVDNSAMDGYALRSGDWTGPEKTFPLGQRITAGSVPEALEKGTAARIFTGAAIPAGADTVVMQEKCDASDTAVRILQPPQPGDNIRPRGQDVHEGQTALVQGGRLRAQEVGLAASLGIAELPVFKRLRVAVLSTGDELAEPGEPPAPGRIFNSNRYLMNARLSAWGFEPVDLGVAKDDFETVRNRLEQAAGLADVILTSGGVSVGEEDHVKAAVRSLGAIDLWKIAVKPGKPFAFGQVCGTPFLGLPGNPVSVLVTLLVIARPYLFACQGTANAAITASPQKALFSRQASWREDYIRVRHDGNGVEPYPNQSSGALFSTCWADGLLRQPADTPISAGDTVDYLPFSAFD